MVKDGEFVAVFHSVHRVMQVEKLLKDAGLKIRLIPSPRSVSSDCGLAIRFQSADSAQVAEILSNNNIDQYDGYVLENRVFQKLEKNFNR